MIVYCLYYEDSEGDFLINVYTDIDTAYRFIKKKHLLSTNHRLDEVETDTETFPSITRWPYDEETGNKVEL